MPSIIKKMLKQVLIYWPPTAAGADGRPAYTSPVEVRCRWEDTQEEYRNASGATVLSKCVVYTGVDVAVNGLLWLTTAKPKDPAGTALAQLPEGLTDPQSLPGAQLIGSFESLPTLNQREKLRTAMC